MNIDVSLYEIIYDIMISYCGILNVCDGVPKFCKDVCRGDDLLENIEKKYQWSCVEKGEVFSEMCVVEGRDPTCSHVDFYREDCV